MHKLLTWLLLLFAGSAQATPIGIIQFGGPSSPTFSVACGSYSSTQSVTLSAGGTSIYYTTDGTTPTTASTLYSSEISVSASETLNAISATPLLGRSAIATCAYTITVSGGPVFPQIGIQAIEGTQHMPTANLQQMATYQWIELGGNFEGWPGVNAANGGYGTRDQVVQALKSFTGSGGKNAVLPYEVQYENPTEFNPSAPWFTDWYNCVNSNNWWVYNSGTSGTKTQSIYVSTYIIANPAHLVGTDSGACGFSGLYPWQVLTNLLYKRFYLGTGSGGSAMASTHLDGYFLDNESARNLMGSAADWERNGSNPSQTDPTATGLTSAGKADYCSTLAGLNSAIACTANTEFAYDLSPSGCGALGMTSSNNQHIYAQGMSQFMMGTTLANGGVNNVLDFGGFSCFMTWYNTLESGLASGGTPLVTGSLVATDYVGLRYSLTAVLMRNGIAVFGLNAAGNEDTIDPGNTATYPVFDEFWGGTKNLAGYMGATVSGARGAEQSSAWSNGVWERTYANCIALVNPAANGSQTVSISGLGTYYFLHGSQDATHNPGGMTPVSSLIIAAGDGYILCNTPSAMNLPAANDDYFHRRLNGTLQEAA